MRAFIFTFTVLYLIEIIAAGPKRPFRIEAASTSENEGIELAKLTQEEEIEKDNEQEIDFGTFSW